MRHDARQHAPGSIITSVKHEGMQMTFGHLASKHARYEDGGGKKFKTVAKGHVSDWACMHRLALVQTRR